MICSHPRATHFTALFNQITDTYLFALWWMFLATWSLSRLLPVVGLQPFLFACVEEVRTLLKVVSC